MEKCIVLFTGGKESVFSLMEVKNHGYEVSELVFLEKPGFSIHKVNLPAVKAVAKMLGYELRIIRADGNIQDSKYLVQYLGERKEEGVNVLITGNVRLEENHRIHKRLCEEAGLKLVEPLREWDTLELLTEYLKTGIHFMIIGIRSGFLESGWLGRTITEKNFEDFLVDIATYGVDPCGEYGEYHSIVVGLKSLGVGLRYTLVTKKESDGMEYIVLQDIQLVKDSDIITKNSELFQHAKLRSGY